jgi:hypothetical protein
VFQRLRGLNTFTPINEREAQSLNSANITTSVSHHATILFRKRKSPRVWTVSGMKGNKDYRPEIEMLNVFIFSFFFTKLNESKKHAKIDRRKRESIFFHIIFYSMLLHKKFFYSENHLKKT